MNEELYSTSQDPLDADGGDPIPTDASSTAETESILPSEPAVDERSDTDEERSDSVEEAVATNPEDPLLFADPGEGSDPDPGSDPEQDSPSGMDELRSELKRLQEEISKRDALLSRMGRECEEFGLLYPNVAFSALPDSVWEDVRHGIPLAAAYALAERRRLQTAQAAQSSNQQNAVRSTGALEGTDPDYFSPAEVRAMNQSEVRANYHKIMQSMQKWR